MSIDRIAKLLEEGLGSNSEHVEWVEEGVEMVCSGLTFYADVQYSCDITWSGGQSSYHGSRDYGDGEITDIEPYDVEVLGLGNVTDENGEPVEPTPEHVEGAKASFSSEMSGFTTAAIGAIVSSMSSFR